MNTGNIFDLQLEIQKCLKDSALELYDIDTKVEISPADPKFADFQTNLPFSLVKKLRKAPPIIGKELADSLGIRFKEYVNINVAGGFINFSLNEKFLSDMVRNILSDIDDFTTTTYDELKSYANISMPEKIHLEYVSANPTGPMNVVSARAAAVGDTIARLMNESGFNVHKEYYNNDAGVQVQLLEKSFNARLQEAQGKPLELPENGYHGDYLKDYAQKYLKEISWDENNAHKIPAGEWILSHIIHENREVLARFNTEFDRFFSEDEFRKTNAPLIILDRFKPEDLYENEGAIWFKSSNYNEKIKDYVLKKSDGNLSYFLVDIAYNVNKLEARGFDKAVILLGPDHHNHGERMQAAMEALGFGGRLEVIILQQVNLFEDGEKVKMSKRAGRIIMMQELLDEVGVDVARYFFLTRKMEAHLDFDLDLAKSNSDDNPIYYIQYAHARLNNILVHAKNKGYKPDSIEYRDMNWNDEGEMELLKKVARMPGVIQSAATSQQPHLVAFYLLELAREFHPFYFKYRIVGDDKNITERRIILSKALKKVFAKGLSLLGISAPDNM